MCVKKNFKNLFSLRRLTLFIVVLFASTSFAYAHQPVIEKDASVKPANSVEELYAQAIPITDPTFASQAIYGRLSSPTEIDLYTFTPAQTDTIPIEAMVPINPANQSFRPAVLVVGEDIVSPNNAEFPLPLPAGYGARVIAPPVGARSIFTEEFSIERLYHGTELKLKVTAGKPYYIAIYEPGHQVGSYALGLGTAENFSNTSYPALLKNVAETKLGLMGERFIPWMDIIGLFVSLIGFICGLGGIFVLAMTKSALSKDYGQAASTVNRTTQSLVWMGLVLSIVGAAILYRTSKLSGVALFQLVIACILILNLLYYGIIISPRLSRLSNGAPSAIGNSVKRRADLSLLVAVLAWMGGLFLLCWYLYILR